MISPRMPMHCISIGILCVGIVSPLCICIVYQTYSNLFQHTWKFDKFQDLGSCINLILKRCLSLSLICFSLGTNWKFNCRKEPKIQPARVNQCSPSRNQEIMFICGLSFHVTTKLLQGPMRSFSPSFSFKQCR